MQNWQRCVVLGSVGCGLRPDDVIERGNPNQLPAKLERLTFRQDRVVPHKAGRRERQIQVPYAPLPGETPPMIDPGVALPIDSELDPIDGAAHPDVLALIDEPFLSSLASDGRILLLIVGIVVFSIMLGFRRLSSYMAAEATS